MSKVDKDDRLISLQAAIDCLCNGKCTEEGRWCDDGDCMPVRRIKSLPSEQPEVARRIVGKSRDGMTFWYQCDMCNEPVDAQDNFCRGCGRRLIDE